MRRKFKIYFLVLNFQPHYLDEANKTASHFLNLPPEIEFFESGILGKSNLYSTINLEFLKKNENFNVETNF